MGNASQERLKKDITGHFKRMFNDVLGTVQILVKNEYQYDAARAKILRSGNNALRDILRDIDQQGQVGSGSHDEVYKVD